MILLQYAFSLCGASIMAITTVALYLHLEDADDCTLGKVQAVLAGICIAYWVLITLQGVLFIIKFLVNSMI